MDSLPLVAVDNIAKFLSVKELSACCAVCRRWRNIFNQDSLWKRHCDPSLELYLRITPCVVHPAFVSPAERGSSLSPICLWRLAFMRENHLFNNWRLGNYCSQVVTNSYLDVLTSELSYFAFLTDDIILVIVRDTIMICDLRSDLTVYEVRPEKDSVNFHFCPDAQIQICNTPDSNMFVVLRYSGVQVVQIHLSTMEFTVKHVFFFEDSESIADDDMDDLGNFNDFRPHNIKSPTHTVIVGTIFVGVCDKKYIHIWDLESGLKLKEDLCPIYEPHAIVGVKHSETTQNILFEVLNDVPKKTIATLYCFVYNLTSLMFLNFTPSWNYLFFHYEFAIDEDCVYVWCNNELQIYRYHQSKLLSQMPSVDYFKELDNHYILGLKNKVLVTCDKSKKTVLSQLFLDGFYCQAIRGKMIAVIKGSMIQNYLDTMDSELPPPQYYDIWEIHSTIIRKTELSSMTFCPISAICSANKTSTKLISKECGSVSVVHFW